MKHRTCFSDLATPIGAYAAVAQKGSCLLETALEAGEGRRSFIGIEPIASFLHKNDGTDPYAALRKMREELRLPAVGFVSYDAVRIKERISSRHSDPIAIPDLFFQFYRTYLTFDHRNSSLEIFAESDAEIDRILERISQGGPRISAVQEAGLGDIACDLSDAEFCLLVEQAKKALAAGEVFQVVLSRSFEVKTDRAPFEIYRALRKKSPAPYLFFIECGGLAILGASPEKLISVENGRVESMPIAGTCAVGGSIEQLRGSAKEAAEHVMLVDLARNDIGAVCVPGTVRVSEYMQPKSFSHVTHLVSRVAGTLDPRFDAIDAFKASFPAGTVSGAPKIRAMELIDELETSRRGMYGGAVVMLDGSGNLESCIAIRMAVVRNGSAIVRAGAGIVLDSDPQKEADETRMKANTVLDVLAFRPLPNCLGGAPV